VLLAEYLGLSGSYILVVGVEHSRDGLRTLLVSDGALVLARVELLEIELAASCLASPQTEVVACVGLVTGDYAS
jgi:hypothetical protein